MQLSGATGKKRNMLTEKKQPWQIDAGRHFLSGSDVNLTLMSN